MDKTILSSLFIQVNPCQDVAGNIKLAYIHIVKEKNK